MFTAIKGYRTIIVMLATLVPLLIDFLTGAEAGGLIPQELMPAYAAVIAFLGMVMRVVTSTPFGRK